MTRRGLAPPRIESQSDLAEFRAAECRIETRTACCQHGQETSARKLLEKLKSSALASGVSKTKPDACNRGTCALLPPAYPCPGTRTPRMPESDISSPSTAAIRA